MGIITLALFACVSAVVTCAGASRDVAVIPHDTHPGYNIKKFAPSSSSVEGGAFNYRLLENGYSEFFTMLEDGSVMTTSDLSPLVNRPVSLVVLEETPNTTATHTLHLYVLDRRNMLRFEACSASECVGHVRENLAAGTEPRHVPPLRATAGKATHFPVSYTIISGNNDNAFQLKHSETGDIQPNITLSRSSQAVVLVTAQILDREDIEKYELTIQATDSLGISRATVKIVIVVDDENDNSPVFTEKVYRFIIGEDDTSLDSVVNVSLPLKRFSRIGRVEATDADGDRVAYRLLAPSNVVVIVPQTGELLLIEEPTEELDCEFVVEAHDLRTPSRTSPRPAQVLFSFRVREPDPELEPELQRLEARELTRSKRRVTRAVRPTKRIEFTETDGETEGRSVFQLEKETDRETFKIRDENAWVTVEPNGAVRVKKKWDYEELGPEKTIDFWVTITNAGNGAIA